MKLVQFTVAEYKYKVTKPFKNNKRKVKNTVSYNVVIYVNHLIVSCLKVDYEYKDDLKYDVCQHTQLINKY